VAVALAGGGTDMAITVNSVAPGEISTPITGQTDADPREQRRPGIPLGRTGHAAEVAAAVAFLATPAAGYITGTSLVVDGGLLLMGAQAGTAYPADDWRSPQPRVFAARERVAASGGPRPGPKEVFMRRESDLHSPREDDELKAELDGTLRGNGPTRAEEGRDAEGPADDDPDVPPASGGAS
jgi:hypothetical protein